MRIEAIENMRIERFKSKGGATSGNRLLGPPFLSSKEHHTAVRGGRMNPIRSVGTEVNHTTPMMFCIAASLLQISLLLSRGTPLPMLVDHLRSYIFSDNPLCIMGADTHDRPCSDRTLPDVASNEVRRSQASWDTMKGE